MLLQVGRITDISKNTGVDFFASDLVPILEPAWRNVGLTRKPGEAIKLTLQYKANIANIFNCQYVIDSKTVVFRLNRGIITLVNEMVIEPLYLPQDVTGYNFQLETGNASLTTFMVFEENNNARG